MKRLIAACLACILFFFSNSLCASAPDLTQVLAHDPALKLGQLPNGLTYYIQRNKKPEKKAELRLVLKVGSILEDADQQGVAHFVEHMGFASTQHFQKQELVSWLQSIGVQFGSDLAAFTSFDDTKYILQIPTDQPAQLEKAFLVLQDWAAGMLFKPDEIEAERSVILEELRSHQSADERLARATLAKTLQGTRYPQRWPIGQVDEIKRVDQAALQRFYRDWYRPDLMAVIVVGDLEPALAEKMIQRHFAHLKNPPDAKPRLYLTPTYPATSEAVVLTDPAASTATVSIRYAILPSPEYRTLADLRQGWLQELLTQIGSRRLTLLTQQRDPLILSGIAAFSSMMPGYQSYFATASISKKGITGAVETLIQEKNRLRRFGVSDSELAFAKANLLSRLQHAAAERDKSESVVFANRYIQHFLQQTPIPGAARELSYAQQLLPDISQGALNRFIVATLDTQADKLIGYIGIEQPPWLQPDPPKLLGYLHAAEKLPVAAPREETLPEAKIKPLASSGTIIAESANPTLGITELRLSNGIRVWLKPTPFQDNQIAIGAVRGGGSSLYNGLRIISAQHATSAVSAMGLQPFSPTQLQQVLAGKSANVAVSILPTTEKLAGSAAATDLEALLQLVHLGFGVPRRDEDLFNFFTTHLTGLMRAASVNPEQQLAYTSNRALLGNNPWLAPIRNKEEIALLQLDDLIDIYQARFGSAAGFTFVLVGNFEVERVKPLLATWLGSLPSRAIATEPESIGLKPPRGVRHQSLQVGDPAKSIVSLSFAGLAPKRRHEAIRLRLLGDILSNRINEILREQLGLIYSGSADGQIDPDLDHLFTFGIYLPCGPENIERVQAAITQEIRQLQTIGPSPEQLNKVKQHWLSNRKSLLTDNHYWLNHLMKQSRQPASDQFAPNDGSAIMASITSATLQQAARDYLDLENCVHVVVNPPNKPTK